MIFLAIALTLQQAQPPALPRDTLGARAPAQSIVEGRVVADENGQPLRNARVTLTRSGRDESDPVLTDDAGRFRFGDVDAGRYLLRARKPGYAAARFGARRALDPAIPFDVAAGAHVRGIELRLVRGAAISGRVLDDLGEPVVDAAITAAQLVRTGTQSKPVAVRVARTDDLGEYRLYALPPGTYIVSGKVVDFGPGRPLLSLAGAGFVAGEPTYPQVYFPSVPTPGQAQKITVAAGQEVTSTDLVFRQIRRPKLVASVTDASGQPVGGRYMVGALNEIPGVYVRGGTFTAGEGINTDIDPGDSLLHVTTAQGDAIARFTAGEDDVVRTVVVTKGATVSGRVVFEGASPPSASTVLITAGPTGGGPMLGMSGTRPKPDGTFVLQGLHGTLEFTIRNLPAGWAVRSFTMGGRDAMDGEIDFRGNEDVTDALLTLTNVRSQLAFTVVNDEGTPAVAASVVVFAADPPLATSARRSSLVRADTRGFAAVDDLPPGAYLAVALPDVDETRWDAPEYLDELRPLATQIGLAAGERKRVSLTMRRVQ